jgi:cysteine desulfurase
MRSGTENVSGDIGLSIALEESQAMRKAEIERLHQLQKLFIDGLDKRIPEARLNGSLTQRLPNNIHITIPGRDNERLMMELDERGIMCAVGSACSASSDEPSHVLKSLGLSDKEAQASLRFTMGRQTTKADIQRTIEVLAQII